MNYDAVFQSLGSNFSVVWEFHQMIISIFPWSHSLIEPFPDVTSIEIKQSTHPVLQFSYL